MSPEPMTRLSEERLAQLLRAETEQCRPAVDGAARIAERVAARRRGRVRRRAAGSFVALAVVVAIAVPVADHLVGGSGSGRQVVRVVPPSGTARARSTPAAPATHTAPTFAPSTQLVTIEASQLQILSAADGKVAGTLDLSPPLLQSASGTASVDPTGRTAYVSIPFDVSCSAQEVVAIDLQSGHTRVVATSAYDPAVSPDGTRLAYIDATGPTCGAGTQVAGKSEVTVETLHSGSRRSWIVSPPSSAPPSDLSGGPFEILNSLAWAPDGHRLVIGASQGPASGVQILDTTRAPGAGNPQTVGPYTAGGNLPSGRYRDPALLPNGAVAAISPLCWGGMTCPPDPHAGAGLVTLDAATAHVDETLLSGTADPGFQLSGLAVDASGRRLAVQGSTFSGQESLYVVSGGRLHAVATGTSAFAWLPLGLGRVKGTLRATGGPAPGINRPEPGAVEVISIETGPGQRRHQTFSVGADGRFSFSLAAGSYELSGSSPHIAKGAERCSSLGPVRVVAGRITRADVVCSVR